MIKNVVLLNDTSYENHHGCNTVIKNIEKCLSDRNIKLIYSNPIGISWRKNKTFLNALKNSDAVIINAEGTVHNSSEYAYSLLEVVEFTSKPCFIINMTYQNNSEKFLTLIKKFKKVYVRESFSKSELDKFSVVSKIVPDMTFFTDVRYINKLYNKKNILVTDSHDIKKSEVFYNYSKNLAFSFFPVLSPIEKYSNLKSFFKIIKYNFFIYFGKLFPLKYKYKRFLYVKDFDNFLNELLNCKLLISARFHTICLGLHFHTPFIAVKSNTFKIEGLLYDIGLDNNRIIEMQEILKLDNFNNVNNCFSDDEIKKIDDYIKDAKNKINDMFDEIANG